MGAEKRNRALSIVDAHQHFWNLDRNYHPWLCDEPPVAFRYGDYRRIRRNYLPADYFRDSAAFEVTATVYVEAEWDPEDPIGETRWIHSIADTEGFPSAVVAQAWLDRDDVAEVLDAQAAFPLVRSIRHKPAAAATPDAARAGAAGSMGDARWRRGYARLEGLGLSFDLQTPWWHLGEARALAGDFPGIQMILNHTGLPADRSAEGLAAWRRAMRDLAAESNVAVKISGLGVPGAPWTVDANGPIVRDTIDAFGIERCMFASNFPVDGLVADFDTIFGGFAQIVAELSPDDRRMLFCDNARRIYRIA